MLKWIQILDRKRCVTQNFMTQLYVDSLDSGLRRNDIEKGRNDIEKGRNDFLVGGILLYSRDFGLVFALFAINLLAPFDHALVQSFGQLKFTQLAVKSRQMYHRDHVFGVP